MLRLLTLACVFSESLTRWGQELCFVVQPQGSAEEEGSWAAGLPPASDKSLKTQ